MKRDLPIAKGYLWPEKKEGGHREGDLFKKKGKGMFRGTTKGDERLFKKGNCSVR